MKKILFLFIFILITNLVPTNEEIVFVFEHFRHGARSSVFVNKNYTDKYDIKWIGDGELTSVGMRMLYLIGVHIRTKYNNLINTNTSSKELLVFSTDLNRTILSAESQLLGMFPPQKGDEINIVDLKFSTPPNIISKEAQNEISKLGNTSIPYKFRAIPINFFHKEKKPYLLTEEDECPRTKYIKEENFNKEHVQDFIKEFSKKYSDKLVKYFNITDKSIFENYFFLLGVTDHFISNYIHKRKNLKYFEDEGINLKEYYEECVKFKNISLYEIETTKELGIMASSPIFKDLLHYMDNVIKLLTTKENLKTKEKKRVPKFIMYSGHDYIIASVQLFLKEVFNTPCFYPGFAANQFFELHKADGIDDNNLNENNFHVEYFFNGKLYLNVSYPQFKEKISKLIWTMEQITEFCQVEKYSFVDYFLYIAILFSLISISFAMIKENIADKKNNSSKNKYQINKSYEMQDI